MLSADLLGGLTVFVYCVFSLLLDKELADELSKFYRDFLDGNYRVHSRYLR